MCTCDKETYLILSLFLIIAFALINFLLSIIQLGNKGGYGYGKLILIIKDLSIYLDDHDN